MLKRWVILAIGYFMVVGCHVLAMTKGWGLEPKSYWWIVLAGVLGPIFIRAFAEAWVDSKPQVYVQEMQDEEEE